MNIRRTVTRSVRLFSLGTAAVAGLLVLIGEVHLSLNAYYGRTSMSWAENYLQFLAGANRPTLLLLLANLRTLIALAFVHAVWRRNLTVVTACGLLATAESGIEANLPPSLEPVAEQICPACSTSGTGVEVPVWVLIVAAALLCNINELLGREKTTGSGHGEARTPEAAGASALSERGSSRLLANLSGYTLVASFLSIAVGASSFVGALPNVGTKAAVGLALCALVFYEFVTTDAALSLVALALVTWHTGLATLQYDTPLSRFLLATATLLTISAVGFLYSNLRGHARGARLTHQS